MQTSTPANWSINKATLHDAASLVRSMLALEKPPMSGWSAATLRLPVYYDDYCRRRYLAWRQTHPATDWDDVEPIFALAAVTAPSANGSDADERRKLIKANFARLRGASPLAWRDAERLIMQAWAALVSLE